MNNFYNDLFIKSQIKPIEVHMKKTPLDEDDTTILFRLNEYGVKYKLSNYLDRDFEKIKTEATVSDSYSIKF
jgi:hypothetical protein